MRLQRTLLGLTQEMVGEALGLSFQQIQKYERGTNRMGASRLFDLSRVLDVPISFFFDDMDVSTAEQAPRLRVHLSGVQVDTYERDPLARRETMELVRAYYGIADPKVRKRLFEFAKTLAP